MNVTVQQFGAEFVAESLRRGVKSFQREQRKQMSKAARVVKNEVVKRVHMRFGVWRPKGKGKQRELGPLFQRIRSKVRYTTANTEAFIEPTRLGFYGRYLETGLQTTGHARTKAYLALEKQQKSDRSYFRRKSKAARQAAKSEYPINIPKRPYLAPAMRATERQVVAIMGDAFKVFQGNGGGGE